MTTKPSAPPWLAIIGTMLIMAAVAGLWFVATHMQEAPIQASTLNEPTNLNVLLPPVSP